MESQGSIRRTARPGTEVRFFRNYNRTIGVAYGGLLLCLAAFFAWQTGTQFDREVATIRGHVERHAQLIEYVLQSTTDQVESMRMAAGRSAATEEQRAHCTHAPEALAARHLREGSTGGFQRDTVADRDGSGNLVGEGRLAGRSVAFYCDLDAALALDAQLRSLPFHLPHAARMRFVSAQHFHLVTPWRPSAEVPFTRAEYDEPLWRLGDPAANPDRLKYWGPTYFGGPEVGLLAPVAAPVYDRERFMGVLAIDMSLDYLHRINTNFGYPLGAVALVDGDGKVLAHPALYADPLAVRAPALFGQVLPPTVVRSVAELARLPDREPVQLHGLLLVKQSFRQAPWQLVYAVPVTQVWARLLAEFGPSMLAMLAVLGLLMALTYSITAREFVGPAAKLVRHLVAESDFKPLPVPRVPRAWLPWFDAISRAFRQSLELSVLRKELDIAANMQQAILPRHWPDDPRYTLWGTTAPAREVGGDFYDHFPLADGRCALVVADVSGKGIGAGLFAMVSKTLLRSVATHREGTPGEIAASVNDGLCADNDTSMFVTAFYAHYDPATGEFVYANAGHPPPVLIHANGGIEWLPATGGTAFGVMEGLPYRQHALQLHPGDTVLVYTDGVTEATDAAGEQFGNQRLEDLLAKREPAGARDAIDRVLQAVRAFSRGVEQFDDITCVALHCHRWGEGG